MPRISVVVPAYNIERYLTECLQSIADQSVTDLEVLVVDDGSSDGTAEVARSFVERDPRFRLLTQPNGGLGHARNEGAARVSGEFLSFVDGDDILPRRAYEILLDALDQTGSDFATGNVHRFSSMGTRQSAMFEDAFAETMLATHVSQHPDLLTDRIAPNKLWRRSFWDENAFRFPEGVLHEDITVAVPAHVLARSVDVISEPCYLYRMREGTNLSITQNRLDPKAIRDRTQAVDTVSRFLAARGDRRLKRLYDEACADQDFRYTLEQLDEADDAFRTLFLDLVNDFFDRSHRGVFDNLPAVDRLAYYLVRRRMMPELLDVLRFDKTRELDRTRDVRRGRRIYANLPYFEDPVRKIPRRIFRIDNDLRMRRQVDDVRWEGRRLVIEGHAFLHRMDMIHPADSTVRLTLEAKGGRLLELPVERVARPDVTAAARTTVFDYTWSGFRTSIDVADLIVERRGSTVWRMFVDVHAEGQRASRRIYVAAPGRPQRPEVLTVRGTRVVPATRSGRFGITVDPMPVVVDGWRADGDVLQLEGTVRARDLPELDPYSATLLLDRETESGRLTYPVALTPADDKLALLARLPLRELTEALEVGDQASHAEDTGDGLVWTVSLRPGPDQDPVPLVARDDLPEVRHVFGRREVLLGTTRMGRLSVIERGLRPIVTALQWSADHQLVLVGDYPATPDESLELAVLADGQVEERLFAVQRDGTAFTVSVPVRAVPSLAGALPLPAGTWSMEMRKSGGGATSSAPVKINREVRRALPLPDTAGRRQVVARYADFDSLRIDVGPDLLADEVGGFNQNRLQTVEFPAFVRQGLRDAVLFESYGAVQYADSPRAIAEELLRRGTDLELLWAVEDEQTELPDGITAVPRDSRAWYEATARSRYVVTCVYRPMTGWLTPHPDQVVLQTWHGPPFKKIGFDSQQVERQARRGYHDRLALETSRWNYLVSPSPAATPILRSAFRYGGTVLETGYPRTDVFFRPDRDEVAARVRARLGLPEGKKVVLYAPTFRDNQQYRRNRFRLDLHLDLADAEKHLADDHVLLVRRHAKIVDSLRGAGEGFVRDVSRYPDVNDLLLVTDVLVSDYSSLMFDFANTGRPMLFFTYDLEQYRDELRGFYFDLDIMPGPKLRTSAEVVAAVGDADRVRAQYDDAYRSFVDTFCAFDDGTASAEVVSTVFGDDAGHTQPATP